MKNKKINIYYILYYRIYKATYRTNRNIIEWSSMITLSLLVYFNFICILILLDNGSLNEKIGKLLFKGGFIISLLVNYFVFIKGKKYVKIVEENKISKISRFQSFSS